ncbi:ChbG/HpnK family deacetylase [Carnobacteriaceae bacterium 52-44]
MDLLFQSDDFGITEAVTLGIIKGIEEGIIRNTGLFVNMESSKFAASFISKYPDCCFGLDINLVAGKPLSDPKDIPSLVDGNGRFISSIERFKKETKNKQNGITIEFEEEPFHYEDVLVEMEAQILKFIDLVGKKPEYIHPHSVVTPSTIKAFRKLSKKYNLKFSMDFLTENNFYMLPLDWNIKPIFKVEEQLKTDVTENTLKVLEGGLKHKKSVLICHAGYVDANLLDVSSYSLIRVRDLEMATSKELLKYIKENDINLITYRDI